MTAGTAISTTMKQVGAESAFAIWGVDASSGVAYGNHGWTRLPGKTGCGQLSTETDPFSPVAFGSSTFIHLTRQDTSPPSTAQVPGVARESLILE